MLSDGKVSIWFGYYKRFPRSFTRSGITDKPKSTRKYLLDLIAILFQKAFEYNSVSQTISSLSSENVEKKVTSMADTWFKGQNFLDNKLSFYLLLKKTT